MPSRATTVALSPEIAPLQAQPIASCACSGAGLTTASQPSSAITSVTQHAPIRRAVLAWRTRLRHAAGQPCRPSSRGRCTLLYLVSATAFLALENRSPQSTFAWLFLMVLAPGVGPVVYFLFGRGSKAFSHRKALRRQLGRTGLSKELEQVREAQEEARHELSDSDIEIYRRLPQLLWTSTEAPLTMGNSTRHPAERQREVSQTPRGSAPGAEAHPSRILRVGRRSP